MSEQKHNEIIQAVLDDFDERFESASKVLENRIAERILATTTVDELLELRLQVNNDFREIITERVKQFMPELDAVARDTIANTPLDVTPQDNRVAAELKAQSFSRIQESVNTSKENVNKEIVLGALAGYGLATVAQNARHAISGLMITVDDIETTRLQNKLRKLRAAADKNEAEIAATVSALRNKFDNVSVGSAMSTTVTAEMHDEVMQFDGVFVKHRARQAGLKKFKYSGTIAGNSRDFCIRTLGKTFTEEEARRLWASESWSGKASGDPFVVRGGHRCRHFWIPVED